MIYMLLLIYNCVPSELNITNKISLLRFSRGTSLVNKNELSITNYQTLIDFLQYLPTAQMLGIFVTGITTGSPVRLFVASNSNLRSSAIALKMGSVLASQ